MPQLHNLRMYLDRSVYIDKDKFLAKITMKQHVRILAKIKEKLEDWELDLFRASCLGHFLYLDPEWLEGGKTSKRNTFVDQFVHFLMLRHIRTSKKKELWFLMEGKPARFSLIKFG